MPSVPILIFIYIYFTVLMLAWLYYFWIMHLYIIFAFGHMKISLYLKKDTFSLAQPTPASSHDPYLPQVNIICYAFWPQSQKPHPSKVVASIRMQCPGVQPQNPTVHSPCSVIWEDCSCHWYTPMVPLQGQLDPYLAHLSRNSRPRKNQHLRSDQLPCAKTYVFR